MRGRKRLPNYLYYIISVLATLFVMVISEKLEVVLSGQHPLFLYMAVVTLSSLYGGFGPGACSAVLSTTLHNYFVQYPKYTFSINSFGDLLELVLFVSVAGLISWVGASMRSAKREAEEASRAREEMVAIVSHDLKNPLTAIGISTQMISKAKSLEESKSYAEKIARSTKRMSRLINSILDVEKIKDHRFLIDHKVEDIKSLLDEITADIKVIAKDRAIAFSFNSPSKLMPLKCDRDGLTQVLTNLLGNALKFTPPGGEIILTLEDRSSDIFFQVQDTGLGIEENDIPHIFEQYWQAPRTAKAGTGLGLYIADKIIEAHGGKIQVASSKGKGTTFSFFVPKF
jgi:signal transduction histidine kinase